jgi:hypothetical protein
MIHVIFLPIITSFLSKISNKLLQLAINYPNSLSLDIPDKQYFISRVQVKIFNEDFDAVNQTKAQNFT